MLQRAHTLAFMPGVHVFPGGAVDPADAGAELQALCAGLDDAAASRALGVERGGLAYWIAAVREAFEEAGILLAYDDKGGMVAFDDTARFQSHRQALHGRRGDFAAVLRDEGLRLAADRLIYFGHWITPVTVPRRYDTRFFLAIAPERQEAMHDRHETIAHVWMRPQEALDLCAGERINLRLPTIRTLERFADCASVAEWVTVVSSAPVVRALQPRITRDGRSVLPGEPGYEDAGGV